MPLICMMLHLRLLMIADVDEGGAGEAVPAPGGAAQAQPTRERLVKDHIVQVVRRLTALLYPDQGATQAQWDRESLPV
jgi:hypothetical protein